MYPLLCTFLVALTAVGASLSTHHAGGSSVCSVTADAGPDTALCLPGGTYTLQGGFDGDAQIWEWSPQDGLDNPFILQPTADITAEITYTLTVYGPDPDAPNLTVNGDFSGGNAFFTTDYAYVADDPASQVEMWPEGTYAVVTNPNLVHSNFSSCSDHTDGSGQMLVVNGAASYQNVWCQTISVNPNSFYNFEAWVASVNSSSPAQLQFSINGISIGEVFNATSSTCLWQQFNAAWRSGSAATAEICILNLNTQPSGNDFALDDIGFYELCPSTDEVTISLIDEPAPLPEITGPDVLCVGEEYTFNAIVPDSPQVTSFTWTSPTGNILSGQNSQSTSVVWNFAGSGEICVEIETRCGMNQNCFTVQVDEAPGTPVISGPLEICEGETATYNILPDQYTDQIFWIIPPEATLLSGQNSDFVEVVWNTTGQMDICVELQNHCGVSDACFPVDVFGSTWTLIDTALCSGVTIDVNGTEYGNGLNFGIEVMQSTLGCDSTVEIVIQDVQSLMTYDTLQRCAGDSAEIHGVFQQSPGVYLDTLSSLQGCDSISEIVLSLLMPDTQYISTTTCIPGNAGVFVETFSGVECDSTVIRDIALVLSDTTILMLTSCNPADTGVSQTLYTNTQGCDSLVVSQVEFKQQDSTHIIVSTCNSSSAGIAESTYTNIFGCDSLVITETIYNGNPISQINTSTCVPSEAGTDTLTYNNQYGCDSIVIYTVDLLPSDTLHLDALTCDSAQAGELIQTWSNIHGCDSVVITTVSLLPESNCNIEIVTGYDVGCFGDPAFIHISALQGLAPLSVVLTETSSGDSITEIISALNTDLQIVIETEGEYDLKVISASGLVYSETIIIDIPDEIELELWADISGSGFPVACHGDSNAIIYADILGGGISPLQYSWSSGDTVAPLVSVPAGTFSLTVTDATGCTQIAAISIDEPSALELALAGQDVSCFGQADGKIEITVTGGAPDYQVMVNDSAIPTYELSELEPATYVVNIEDSAGCIAVDSITVTEPPSIEISLGADTTIVRGSSILLSADTTGPIIGISWAPTPCDDCIEQIVSPFETTEYSVVARDINGCTAEVNMTVFVEAIVGVYAPNVFSPNGDNVNDHFYLISKAPGTIIDQFRIFDRWGTNVFGASNIQAGAAEYGWDGQFKGQSMLPGVYVFTASVSYPDGTSERVSGDVTLIR